MGGTSGEKSDRGGDDAAGHTGVVIGATIGAFTGGILGAILTR